MIITTHIVTSHFGHEGLLGVSTLGLYVRRRREQLGLTQTQLAGRTGLLQTWISQVENDEIKRPGETKLSKLARGLEIDVRELRKVMGWVLATGEPEEVVGDLKLVEVPYRGVVPADSKRYAEAIERGEMKHVPEPYIQGVREPFALTVSGDCLAEIEIFSGDIVICTPYRNQSIQDGKVVAVRFGDDITLKRWFKTSDGVELRDGKGTVIERLTQSSRAKIEGIVVGNYREFTRL